MQILMMQSLAIAATFIWIGLVLGISFLEAWLKFKAPGVTTAIGLGIGRIVFRALNKLEWLLAIALATIAITRQELSISIGNVMLLAIVVILLVQTAWLLPALDARAQKVINNQQVGPSRLHLIFIAAELIKVGLLFTVGVSLLDDL